MKSGKTVVEMSEKNVFYYSFRYFHYRIPQIACAFNSPQEFVYNMKVEGLNIEIQGNLRILSDTNK